MHPYLYNELARVHAADLARRAEEFRGAARVRPRSARSSLAALVLRRLTRAAASFAPAAEQGAEIRLRYALDADAPALRRLSAELPPPLLVADVDGSIQAALSLWDGRHVADVTQPTADLVELLAVRAAQLNAAALDGAPRSRAVARS